MPFNPYMFNPRAFEPQQSYGQNPFLQMRQKSIFDKPTTPEDNTKRFLSQVNPPKKADFSQSDEPDPQENAMGYYQAMRERQKAGPALTAYQGALKEQPTDDNTQVSTSRKIMGTLAGIAGGFAGGPERGVSTANEIIDSPYKTAMRDYTVKMKNLGESAKMEQDQQEADLKAMEAAERMGLDYKKFNLGQLKAKADQGDKAAQRAIQERTATAAERRASTGEKEADTHLVDVRNRGSIGVLNAADAAKRTDIMGREADTRSKAQKATEKYQDATTEWRKSNGKKVSPTQQNAALDVAYRQLSTDPRYKDFVKLGDKGYFEVNPEKVNADSGVYQEFRRRAKKIAQDSIDSGKLDYLDEEDKDSPWSATIKK